MGEQHPEFVLTTPERNERGHLTGRHIHHGLKPNARQDCGYNVKGYEEETFECPDCGRLCCWCYGYDGPDQCCWCVTQYGVYGTDYSGEPRWALEEFMEREYEHFMRQQGPTR